MKKILAVDDNHDFLFMIKNVLNNFEDDYEIKTVDSATKCLELLQNDTPNLILLDIMMPDIDGFLLFKQIRQINRLKNIPIIFVSAAGEIETIIKAKALADDFLPKPFTANELKDKINKNILKTID